ncbi:MAG TPA: hypothetical protein PK609_01220 [Candidatus Paceibacterota bacterium]|nr:hypothetical protein [Candidatus Paceibacterota bacterium]
MTFEQPEDRGPDAFRSVPNEKPESLGYRDMTVQEKIDRSFAPEEKQLYTAVLAARSLSDLRLAMIEFNKLGIPKDASDFGMSLENMRIDDEPIELYIHDLPSDAQVVMRRGTDGITTLRLIDKPSA